MKNLKQSPIFTVAKQIVLEPQSVAARDCTTKAQGLIHLEPDYEVALKGCSTAKTFAQILQNKPCYILATNILGKDKNRQTQVLRTSYRAYG